MTSGGFIDRDRPGPLLAITGAALTTIALWLPWFSIDGVDNGHNGYSFATGLMGVTLVLSGAFTAVAPKRRPVLDPRRPVTLGLVFSLVAVVFLVGRAVEAPGPAPAAPHIDRHYGLWLALLGAAVTVAGLIITLRQTPPGDQGLEAHHT